MIELRNISKDFGTGEKQIHALHGVSLTVEDGDPAVASVRPAEWLMKDRDE